MENLETNFLNNGFVDLGSALDRDHCKNLLEDVNKTRNFGHDLFIDQEQHKKNPRWTKTIEKTIPIKVNFIEKFLYPK